MFMCELELLIDNITPHLEGYQSADLSVLEISRLPEANMCQESGGLQHEKEIN
jgi:hypothetical protein